MPPTRGKDAASDAMFARIESVLQQRFGGADVRLLQANRIGVDALSRPIYSLRYTSPFGTFADPKIFTRTFSFSQGKLLEPELRPSGLPPSEDGGGTTVDALLQRKQSWISSVARNPLLNDQQKAQISAAIDGYSGGLLGLNSFASKLIQDATAQPAQPSGDPFNLDDFLNDLLGGGGGGGRGGAVGPTYVKPDERAVEDYVKGALVSLVGAVDPDQLSDGVAVYMRDHRRDFDTPGQQIDPTQSVLEYIRGTANYQEIHALRPESEDERSWVSNRRAAGARGGLQQGLQEDFAIQQATIGGDLPDVQDAAGVAQVQASGSTRGTLLEDKIRAATTNMMRTVV